MPSELCVTSMYFKICYALTLLWWRALSYTNQSINLQSKSVDWFLYDSSLRQERGNENKFIFCKLKAIVLYCLMLRFWTSIKKKGYVGNNPADKCQASVIKLEWWVLIVMPEGKLSAVDSMYLDIFIIIVIWSRFCQTFFYT